MLLGRSVQTLEIDFVIPAQAGIQGTCGRYLDSCLRRNDRVYHYDSYSEV